MYANGFLEQKRRSPASFVAVVGLHAAALSAVIMFGTYNFVTQKEVRTHTFDVPITPPPPPDQLPPPERDQQTPRQIDQVTVPPTNNPPVGPIAGPVTPERPYQPPAPAGPRIVIADATPTLPPPVRRAAQVDPNYRDALQPPYPPVEEHAQREGQVRIRITIGANGRVTAVEQLSATSDAFWRVTQRQALGRWRFRPATVDGRPIESTMVMTVTFRIPDA